MHTWDSEHKGNFRVSHMSSPSFLIPRSHFVGGLLGENEEHDTQRVLLEEKLGILGETLYRLFFGLEHMIEVESYITNYQPPR